MKVPDQTEQGIEENSKKKTGTKIVISGALASILLWLIVLVEGSPIRPFSSSSASFGYALAISAPVIILSILVMVKSNRSRMKLP